MVHYSELTSHAAAMRALDAARDGYSRPAGHNTTVHRTGDAGNVAVRYWSTDVVTFTPAGWIILDTDGYWTVTTWARVNAMLPGPWAVYSDGKGGRNLYANGHAVLPFVDGIAVRPSTGEVGLSQDRGSTPVGVLLTAEQVAATRAASETAQAARQAKRAARIAAEHPAPRPLTWREDLPHALGYGATVSPLPNPHRMGSWRAASECPSCRAEAEAWRNVRQETLAADHPAGHAWRSADGTFSQPAGQCPSDCPLRPAGYGWR